MAFISIGKLAYTVAANTGPFVKSMRGVSRRIHKLGQSSGIKGIARIGASALTSTTAMLGLGSAIGTVAGSVALFKRGMAMEEVERSFTSLSKSIGSSSGQMLAKMRTATHSAVSDYELMLASNNAMLLGVAKSDQQFSELAGKAMVLGQALGRGPVESLNDITIGIGRQSKLILDNLGIMIKSDEAYNAYAASIGKTASQLTDAEKKQAFFNATLQAVDEKLAALPTQIESAKVAFSRLGASILNIIDHAMAPVVAAATPFVNELAKKIKEIPIQDVAMGIFDVFSGIIQALAWIIDNVGIVVIAFNLIKAIAGAIGAAIFSTFHNIVVVADEVAQFFGGEGFGEERRSLHELKMGSLEMAGDGFMGIAGGFDQVFYGDTNASDFTNNMLGEMREEMRSALANEEQHRAESDAQRATQSSHAAFVEEVKRTLNVRDPILAEHIANKLGDDREALAKLHGQTAADSVARNMSPTAVTAAEQEAKAASAQEKATGLLKTGNSIQLQQLQTLQEIREISRSGGRLK